MNGHTPAPWNVLPDRNGCLRICRGHNCTIALVYEPPAGFMEANASLIAEAPRLLEALRDLEVCANTTDACYTRNSGNFASALREMRDSAERARTAIAKATGEGA